jgi:hypothetical protein
MPAGTLERPTVAKKRAGRPKSPDPRGPGPQIRLDKDLVAKARIVATRRGLDIGPFLSGLMEGPVNREYAAVLKELAELEGRSK